MLQRKKYSFASLYISSAFLYFGCGPLRIIVKTTGIIPLFGTLSFKVFSIILLYHALFLSTTHYSMCAGKSRTALFTISFFFLLNISPDFSYTINLNRVEFLLLKFFISHGFSLSVSLVVDART